MSGWAQREAERQEDYHEWVSKQLEEAKSVSGLVDKLERELDQLRKLHARTVEFLRTIGPKDPRSGGFIANRVLDRLGEPSNYLVDTIRKMQDEDS